jgi:Na+/H+-dicarboxylate symporter
MQKGSRLTLYIFISMILGVVVGYFIHVNASPETIASVSPKLKLLTTIFLRLVQMIIAPLVFSTLVVGIAKLGDVKTVGRIGGKALLWFVTASLVSLLIGMFWVNVLHPGTGFTPGTGDAAAAKDVLGKTTAFSLEQFVTHLFPKSIFEAMATNEILQIVIFSIFFGVAMAHVGDRAKPVIHALDTIAHVILKMVGYVMNFAPLGVFGALAAVVAVYGVQDILFVYLKYYGAFLVGIFSLWLVMLIVGYAILGKRLFELIKRILNPLAIAFSTTSSEAVFPQTGGRAGSLWLQ